MRGGFASGDKGRGAVPGSAERRGVLQGGVQRKAAGSAQRGCKGEQAVQGVPPTCCPPRQPGQGGAGSSAEGIRGGCAVRRGRSLLPGAAALPGTPAPPGPGSSAGLRGCCSARAQLTMPLVKNRSAHCTQVHPEPGRAQQLPAAGGGKWAPKIPLEGFWGWGKKSHLSAVSTAAVLVRELLHWRFTWHEPRVKNRELLVSSIRWRLLEGARMFPCALSIP